MGELETGVGRTRLRFQWHRRGEDLQVHIAGGTDHIGAVALVGRQPDGKPLDASLHLPPHREQDLALAAARTLHAATGRTVCVTAGIHLDNISSEEISQVLRTVDEGISQVLAALKAQGDSDEA